MTRTKKQVPKAQCGAKTRGGGKCLKGAGWGTNHPGIGKCKLHAGSTPRHVKSAATKEYRMMLGRPMEITPEEAIIRCIHIRAGEVQWLSDRMAELDKKDWLEDTPIGKQFHVYARERAAAMADLVKFSNMAISLNIEERKVRLAETYGELLATFIKALLDDLMPHLDREGKAKAPQLVRQHLLALEAPKTLDDKVAA